MLHGLRCRPGAVGGLLRARRWRARSVPRELLLTATRSRAALLAGLALSQTVSWGILYYAFSVFLQPMEAELGWSRTSLSGAFSIALLASALGAPIAGWTIDRHGPRVLMTIGSAAGVLLLLAWSRVQTTAGLYAVWTGLGLVMACVLYEPAFAVVTKSFGGERKRALTVLTLVAGLASTIFLPLSAHLVGWVGWRGGVVVLSAVLAVATLPIHAGLPRTSAPSGGGEGMAPGTAIRRPLFWILALIFGFAGVGTGALGVHLVSCLAERGMSLSASAALAGTMGAMQLPGRLLFAPLAARLSSRGLTAAVLALQALAIAFLMSEDAFGAAAFAACFGAGSGLMTLSRATLVADVFGTAHYGRLAGSLSAFGTAARAAGPLIAAAIHERSGGYGPVLWTVGALFVLAATGAVLAPFPRAAAVNTTAAAPGCAPPRSSGSSRG